MYIVLPGGAAALLLRGAGQGGHQQLRRAGRVSRDTDPADNRRRIASTTSYTFATDRCLFSLLSGRT